MNSDLNRNEAQSCRSAVLGAAFFLVFGLIFAAIGGALLAGRFGEKSRCTFETKGVVTDIVRIESESADNRSITYAPVFTYVYEGEEYTYQSSTSSSSPSFRKGETVTVMVNPADPIEVYIPDDNASWVLLWVFAGVGAAVALCALAAIVVILIKSRRARSPLTLEDELKQYRTGSGYDDLFK